jgi:2EXR family
MSRVHDLCLQLPKLAFSLAQPCQTFTLFPELPLELRTRIWIFAASIPRNIYLTELRIVPLVAGQSVAPAIMHASQESRTEGKRYYTCCEDMAAVGGPSFFLDGRSRSSTRSNDRNLVWINFSVDHFVYLPDPGHVPAFLTRYFNLNFQTLKRIQHLVLSVQSPVYLTFDLFSVEYILDRIKRLRSFTIKVMTHVGGHPKEEGIIDRQFQDEEEIRTTLRIFGIMGRSCHWKSNGNQSRFRDSTHRYDWSELS